jgi:hypothetical protein
MFTLNIETGNAEMQFARDVAGALRKLADRLEQIDGNCGEGVVRDVDGNTVGRWELTDRVSDRSGATIGLPPHS